MLAPLSLMSAIDPPLFPGAGWLHPVRALGVTGRAKNASLPDVPVIADTVPGYAAEPWYPVSAPKGVPPEILRKLNADINAALKSPDLAQRWESLGVTPLGGSLDDAARRNAIENERWSKVIKAARIQVD